MDISQVKKYLNRQVSYKGSLYNLVGCIIRRSTKENKFIYQARTPKQSREHNLNRTLYNLHKYNEENGTRLSYGQYRAKIESGEIAI